jgi:hypothetical protein
MAPPQIVEANNEELVGIERAAWAYDVVPPADILGLIRVVTGDVMVAG